MRTFAILLFVCVFIGQSTVYGQEELEPANYSQEEPEAVNNQKITFAGLHFGMVLPFMSFNDGNSANITDEDFFAIGFPMGITFKASEKLLIDFEFVPFINPGDSETLTPLSTHLLFHPGLLFPLGKGFTFGTRAAFELGQGQWGFTPLLNKAFKLDNGNAFFVELVLPGRFGPTKDSGYTQVIALHLGIGL